MSVEKTAVFLDLDGTLWVREQIPESARMAIQQAQENGHLIFASTGRARSTAEPLLKDLELDGATYSSGGEVWLGEERKSYRPFSAEFAKKCVSLFEELNAGFGIEGSHRTFLNQKNKDQLARSRGDGEVTETFISLPLYDQMKEEDWSQVMKFALHLDNPDDLDRVLKETGLKFIPFTFSLEGRLSGELTRADTSKATAMEEVVSLLDEPVRTVALGDSANDIEILERADQGIAMGNAVEAAKEAADWVTADIEEDGLYKAFEKLGLFDQAKA